MTAVKPPDFEAAALRVAFLEARKAAQRGARRAPDDPEVSLKFCRYCGRSRQHFAGSRLDGHAACIVDEPFKLRVGDLLRLPTVTYADIAEALGVTTGIVRSWAFSAGVAGPVGCSFRG